LNVGLPAVPRVLGGCELRLLAGAPLAVKPDGGGARSSKVDGAVWRLPSGPV
jgi:hypothetical protein